MCREYLKNHLVYSDAHEDEQVSERPQGHCIDLELRLVCVR